MGGRGTGGRMEGREGGRKEGGEGGRVGGRGGMEGRERREGGRVGREGGSRGRGGPSELGFPHCLLYFLKLYNEFNDNVPVDPLNLVGLRHHQTANIT